MVNKLKITKYGAKKSKFEVHYACPECDTTVHFTDRFCRHCGVEFSGHIVEVST